MLGAIVGAFGIDHAVLYDGDCGKFHDTEVTTGITGAKTSFTKRITRFVNDLGSELGITPLPKNESNRKPAIHPVPLGNELLAQGKLPQPGELFEQK